MTYEEFVNKKISLTKNHNLSAENLERNFPVDGQFGYKQETLDNLSFQYLYNIERKDFKKLQNFNQAAPKQYKRKFAKERR